MTLAGCGLFRKKTEAPYQPKSETELAIGQIKAEMMKRCEGVGPTPQNSVGGLLQDHADISAVAAECITRHNSLVDYLEPIVKKEQSK